MSLSQIGPTREPGNGVDQVMLQPIVFAMILIGVLALPSADAVTINVTYNAGLGSSAPPVADPSGARLVNVVQAAGDYWETLLPGDSRVYNIDIIWEERMDSALAFAYGDTFPSANTNITFASNANYFIDDTPLNHSEFDLGFDAATQSLYRQLTPANQSAYFRGTVPDVMEIGYQGTANIPAASGFDLFTVALHEIGHHLGAFGVFETGDGFWDFDAAFVGGGIGMAIAPGDAAHTAPPQTLLFPAIGAGVRELPSTADILAIASANGYSTIDLPRKEFLFGNTWHNPGSWLGNSTPGAGDDVYIRPSDVLITMNLTSDAQAQNLLIGDRTWLRTHNLDLLVGQTSGGKIVIDGAGSDTTLFVHTDGSAQTGNMEIRNQGRLSMQGGLVIVFDDLLNVADGSSRIVGNGEISLFGANKLNNEGLIRPSDGTLTLNRVGSGRFDLDGTMGTARMEMVEGNLVVNGPLGEAYNNPVTIAEGHSATFSEGWEMAGTATFIESSTPSQEARLNGGTTLSGSMTAETVVDAEIESLTTTPSAMLTSEEFAIIQLSGNTTFGGGNLSGAGTVQTTGDTTVTGDTTISSGTYIPGLQTTVNDGVRLSLNAGGLGAIFPSDFSRTMILNGGELDINLDGGSRPFRVGVVDILDPTLILRDVSDPHAPAISGSSKLILGEFGEIQVQDNNPSTVESSALIRADTEFAGGTINIDAGMRLGLWENDNEFTGDTVFNGSTATLRLNLGSQSTVTGTPVIHPEFVLRNSTLTVTNGGTLTLTNPNATVEQTGLMAIENGTVWMTTGNATLDISAGLPAISTTVEQQSGGKLVISDLPFDTEPDGLYVDGASLATVRLTQLGRLETTQAQIASAQSSPGSGLVTIDDSRWENSGDIYVGGGPNGAGGDGEVSLTSGSIHTGLASSGLVHVFAGDRLNVLGGRMTIGAGVPSLLEGVRINSGSQLINDGGRVRIGGGSAFNGRVSVAAGYGLELDNGTLDTQDMLVSGQAGGRGSIVGDVTVDLGGTFLAGLPTGTLNIDGDYSTSGTTLFGIGGTSAGDFGLLDITGIADLDGTLAVDLVSGFAPSLGDLFTIVTAATRFGTFSANDFSLAPLGPGLAWNVHYGTDFVQLLVEASTTGDFNGDGIYDCLDIDNLVAEIAAGTNGAAFDLTGDGFVDILDRDAWLAEAGTVNLASGNSYLLGDADLDGNVNGADFVIWNTNKFTSGAGWCGGDFNADGFTNGGDFVIWNANKFMSADAFAAVPEPGATLLGLLAMLGLSGQYRRVVPSRTCSAY